MDRSPSQVRAACEALFEKAGLPFSPYQHHPVLDYRAAAEVRRAFGLAGRETKSLFLRGRSGSYAMFVSLEGRRIDWGRAKGTRGESVSLAGPVELREQTGCVPSCAVPLGLPVHVRLLVDTSIATEPLVIFSPGPPEETVQVSGADWSRLLDVVENEVVPYRL